MKRLVWLGSVMVGALLSSSALANDTAMGGHGANLVPLRTSDVFMVSEDITLTLENPRGRNRTGEGPGAKWHVEARYVFSNPSASPVELQFGFPEYRCEIRGPDAEELCQNQMDFHFEGMQTTVRGKSVPHRKGKVDNTHEWAPILGDVWLFDVELAPGEQVPIVHEYRVLSTVNSMGGLTADYVTRTGALWGRPIGRARFTFRYPVRVCELATPSAPSAGQAALPLSEFHIVEQGGQLMGEASYEARDWTPTGDVSFHAQPCSVVRDHFAIEPETLCPVHGLLSRFIYAGREGEPSDTSVPSTDEVTKALEGLSDEHLRLCKNYPFAAYGRPFADSWLSEAFYGAAKPELSKGPFLPFVVSALYSDKLLTPEDVRWVKLVDEVIKRRPQQGKPGEPPAPTPLAAATPSKPAPMPIAPPPPVARSGCSGCTVQDRSAREHEAYWPWLSGVGVFLARRGRRRR